METNTKLYSLTYCHTKTYLFTLLFIAGNIIFPQLCHLIPGGGLMWLPIYFFTLIAAYKYGFQVGLLTAILSPLINCFLFEMPALASLPVILIKSTLLATIGAYVAKRLGKVSIWNIIVVILAYQLIGTSIEWAIKKDFFLAITDFRLGFPGMLVQIFGGYLLLKALAKF